MLHPLLFFKLDFVTSRKSKWPAIPIMRMHNCAPLSRDAGKFMEDLIVGTGRLHWFEAFFFSIVGDM